MLRKSLVVLPLLMISIASQAAPAPGDRDGELRRDGQHWVAWDDANKEWLGVEDFWRAYADRRGGLTWGSSTEYPPYEQVNELDTFLVQLPKGTCLMEFWHSRWRLANDVRRWDPKFNELLGCTQVFD